MTYVMISKLLGVIIFLKINHPKQILMGTYLMEITIFLTINKKIDSSKALSTTQLSQLICNRFIEI
jgi:hypothetical protein